MKNIIKGTLCMLMFVGGQKALAKNCPMGPDYGCWLELNENPAEKYCKRGNRKHLSVWNCTNNTLKLKAKATYEEKVPLEKRISLIDRSLYQTKNITTNCPAGNRCSSCWQNSKYVYGRIEVWKDDNRSNETIRTDKKEGGSATFKITEDPNGLLEWHWAGGSNPCKFY